MNKHSAKKVWFEDDFICMEFFDGRVLRAPLVFYNTLFDEMEKRRELNFKLDEEGLNIHFPEIGFVLPVLALVYGIKEWRLEEFQKVLSEEVGVSP